MAGNSRPIIVKKVKKGGGEGHHGGAWKVAYADFVTAMMAFFLLMWLLNATSEEQLHGLADYFDPSLPISRNSAGGAGMLGGDTIFTPEMVAGSVEDGRRAKPSHRTPGDPRGPEEGFEGDPAYAETPGGIADPAHPEPPLMDGSEPASPAGGAGMVETPVPDPAGMGAPASGEPGAETAGANDGAGGDELEAVGKDLLEEMRAAAEGDVLLRHFSMRMTPEGLVIEIADAEGAPLFTPGSAAPSELLNQLLEIAVPVINRVVNDVAIVGHTDATPFRDARAYGNWELSADRANAARRIMTLIGLDEARIARISGRGATQPLSEDPLAPQNRRIAIILLRESPDR